MVGGARNFERVMLGSGKDFRGLGMVSGLDLGVERVECVAGSWWSLGDELGAVWMELKALDCSGKEEREELVSGRGRGGILGGSEL